MPNLTNEQRKVLQAKRILMEVSPYEAEIVKALRTFQHGRFIIQVLDGVPFKFITETSHIVFEETESADTLKQLIP